MDTHSKHLNSTLKEGFMHNLMPLERFGRSAYHTGSKIKSDVSESGAPQELHIECCDKAEGVPSQAEALYYSVQPNSSNTFRG